MYKRLVYKKISGPDLVPDPVPDPVLDLVRFMVPYMVGYMVPYVTPSTTMEGGLRPPPHQWGAAFGGPPLVWIP